MGQGLVVHQLIDQIKTVLVSFADNALLPVGGIVIVMVIVYGGIQYITGNAENGKKAIIAAIWGTVIITLAWAMVAALKNIL
ncbi:MAG: hypothetical protein V1826_01555 [bacterium]